MTPRTDHDACIAAAPDPLRPLLAHLRAQGARAWPDAGDNAAAGVKATDARIDFSPREPVPDELFERLALAWRRAHGQ